MEHWQNLSLENIVEWHDELGWITEEWKDIVFTNTDGIFRDYSGLYQCSNMGRFKSLDRTVPFKKKWTTTVKGRIRKNSTTPDGYFIINLHKNDINYGVSAHRVIAFMFIHNPLNLPEVNHKKGIKRDNRFHQLEWSTTLDNMQHAYRTKLNKGSSFGKFGKDHHSSIPVSQFTKKGEYIATFEGIADVKRKTGLNTSHICECCKNTRPSASGFKWRYETNPARLKPEK